MDVEFFIAINDAPTKIYMQTGFFNHMDMSFPLHKHPFVEMHILLSGTAVLQCDREHIALQTGDALCVPANMLHTYRSFEKHAKRISFFIDHESSVGTVQRLSFSQDVLSLLCKEIEEYVLAGKDGKLKALLSYLCSDFFITEAPRALTHLKSRELLIDDFFSKRYSTSVTLGDLSKELSLSRKQTEREVKRITGNTFVGELAKRRIDAALILMQTTNLPLAKIAELVGYSSYCGFYKAYKKRLQTLANEK